MTDLPAVFARYAREVLFLLGVPRPSHHKLVITGMSDILKHRYHVDVLQSNVDAYSPGLTVPEEVRQLLRVRDVVRSVHVSSALKILQEDILRRFNS